MTRLLKALPARGAGAVGSGISHGPAGLAGAVLRGAGLTFALQVSGAGLAFFLQVLLARWMGAPEYGVYAYVFSWGTLLAIALGIGLPGTVLRFIPAYRAERDWPRLRGMIRTGYLLALAAGVVFGAVGTGVVAALEGTGVIPRLAPALAGVWLVPLLAMVELQREMSRALGRMGLAYGPPLVGRPLLIIIASYVVLQVTGGLESVEALGVTALAVVLMLLVQFAAFRAALARAVPKAPPAYEVRQWLRVSWPLFLVSGFSVVTTQADVVMVGTILGTEDAGIYNAAAKTALLAGFVLMAVNATAAPAFASLHAEGKRAQMQDLASRAAHWIFWPSLAIAAAMALMADPILGLFGSGFSAAGTALVLLLLAQVINAGAGSVGYLLNVTGYQVEAAWTLGVTALANVALNALLIPLIGLAGAAVATAVSMLLWNAWLHTVVRRRLGVRTSIISALASAWARRGAATEP